MSIDLYLIVFVAAVVIGCYISIALLVFRNRHPWMTETQLFLHLSDAAKFKKVPRHLTKGQ